MKKKLLSLLFLGLILLGCQEDPITEVVEQTIPVPNLWVDSVAGELDAHQQLMQHIIIEVPSSYQSNADSLMSWVKEIQPAYLDLQDWNPDTIGLMRQGLDTVAMIQPAYVTDFNELLELPNYPYWEASQINQSFALWNVFSKGRFGLVQFENEQIPQLPFRDSLFDNLGINIFSRNYHDQNAEEDFNDFLTQINQAKSNVNINLSRYDSIDFHAFRKSSNFKGLFVLDCPSKKAISYINQGADLVRVPIEKVTSLINEQLITSDVTTESLKRVLSQKSKLPIQQQNLAAEIEYSRLNFAHNSLAILSNKDKLIPLDQRVVIHAEDKHRLSEKVRKENAVSVVKHPVNSEHYNPTPSKVDLYILPDPISDAFIRQIVSTPAEKKVVFCFQNPNQYEVLSEASNLIFIPDYSDFQLNLLIQQLTGRVNVEADQFISSDIVSTEKQKAFKLARTAPEFVGYDSDSLKQIGWYVKNAMNGRAFPGCQVLLAKNGCIIFDEQYGFHSYQRERAVTSESIYDLASITKVLATTLVGMKLLELEKYQLDDSLGIHLPDTLNDYLPYPSTIRNITFQELYTHTSGLPAGFPILHYMLYTNEEIGRFDKYYCDQRDSVFSIEIAENFFLDKEYADSMWLKLNQIWLDKSKPYKYSDVSMNTLYMMLKSMIDKDPADLGFEQTADQLEDLNLFEEFLKETYYRPLKLERTMYKPRRKYDSSLVVPTEDERYWRKQLLQGHVHDPNAALMGGIAGNAGLFSNTNEMAVICQMLLNKGTYDQQRFLKEETVVKFTSAQPETHRGLGFNKKAITTTGYGMADSSSLQTYGHTGFTGTCFWIDPAEDLIYIFLSNRVHPQVNNRIYNFGIRKRIHNTAFSARLNVRDF